MIDIRVNKVSLDLEKDVSINFVIKNNIRNSDAIPGFQSYPFKLNWSTTNLRQLGFLLAPEVNVSFIDPIACELYLFNNFWKYAVLKIREISDSYVSVNLYADSSYIESFASEKKLSDLELGGERNNTATPLHPSIDYNISSYDFVCAQIYNDQFYDGLAPSYSNWINYPYQTTYSGAFCPVVPFPYAFYVLKSIFTENGYQVKGDIWNDADLLTLFMLSNRPVDGYIYNNNYVIKGNYNLNQHVPNISISEFVNTIKNMFNLGFFYNNQGKEVEISPIKNIIEIPATKDWSTKVFKNYLLTQENDNGFGFSVNNSFDPALASQTKGINGLNILGYVNDFLDLPSASALNPNDAIFVKYLNAYYKVEKDNGIGVLSWVFASQSFLNFQIGNGKTTVNTNFSVGSCPENTTFLPPYVYPFPVKSEVVANTINRNVGYHDMDLQLLFYQDKGLASRPGNNTISSYFPWNYGGTDFGKYSLDWSHEMGLFNVWWKDWLKQVYNPKIMERYTLLNALDFINLSLKEKVWIEHNEYYIDEINVQITLHEIKPAKIKYIKARNFSINPDLPTLLEEYISEE